MNHTHFIHFSRIALIIAIALLVILTACSTAQQLVCPPNASLVKSITGVINATNATSALNLTSTLNSTSALNALNATNELSNVTNKLNNSLNNSLNNLTETTTTTATTAKEITPNTLVKRVTEGDLVVFTLKATDPDGDTLSYAFTSPLNENGRWQTKIGEAGDYDVNETASDGKINTTRTVRIIVEKYNHAPSISIKDTVFVKEGETVSLDPVITDADNDAINVYYSGWFKSSSYTTNYLDAGTYIETITASDGKLTTRKNVTIIVTNVNRPPTIMPLANISVSEGERVTVVPEVRDPDGDRVELLFSYPLNQNGIWDSGIGSAGMYTANITATDGSIPTFAKVNIFVDKANKAPKLEVPEIINVKEGEELIIPYNVTDPEGQNVTVTVSGWLSTTRMIVPYDAQGTHTATISATDGVNLVTKIITINVEDVNRAPVFMD